jgi:hypothetical protein
MAIAAGMSEALSKGTGRSALRVKRSSSAMLLSCLALRLLFLVLRIPDRLYVPPIFGEQRFEGHAHPLHLNGVQHCAGHLAIALNAPRARIYEPGCRIRVFRSVHLNDCSRFFPLPTLHADPHPPTRRQSDESAL